MEKISVKEILEATKGRLIQGKENTCFNSISTDTRTLPKGSHSEKKGNLFIALKGKNFDGHRFIPEAIKKGAKGIVSQGFSLAKKYQSIPTDDVLIVIEVKDTLSALQDIANSYRRRFTLPLIAITGSNGKTTTKEMLWNILSRKALTLKNKGNYNNEIGVPLTLFELTRFYKFAVLELGTNAPGEIKKLTEIAQPTVGVITNICLTHTEGLLDIEGVAREKLSLLAGLGNRGTTILNIDDKIIRESLHLIKKQGLKKITCGIVNRGNVYATEINDLRERGMKFRVNLSGNKSASQNITIHIPLIGMHNVYNALVAAATAKLFDVPPKTIKNGLESIKTLPMRMEITKLKECTIINDAYNANPHSVEEAISIIEKWNAEKVLASGRKILILGNMLELGKWSVKAHRKLAGIAMKRGIDILVTMGKLAAITAGEFNKIGGTAFVYDDREKLVEGILKQMHRGDLILIKGSRAMKMEEIASGIIRRLGG